MLDYLNASKYDLSDGTSLRKHIEGQSYNQLFDENVVVVEIDKDGFSEEIMVSHRNYKLIIPKRSSSEALDMMFDTKEDRKFSKNLVNA